MALRVGVTVAPGRQSGGASCALAGASESGVGSAAPGFGWRSVGRSVGVGGAGEVPPSSASESGAGVAPPAFAVVSGVGGWALVEVWVLWLRAALLVMVVLLLTPQENDLRMFNTRREKDLREHKKK